ncbi:MAG: hypothetical protein ACJA1A_001434 [Saprospiraceae bacterium]|jgi:hypothetical protein
MYLKLLLNQKKYTNSNLLKFLFGFMAVMVFTLTSCGDDDVNTTGNKVDYDLEERGDSGVSGDIEFVELEDGRLQIEISLSGTESGNTHPAHIHMNSAALGGDIIVSLDPVDGSTGSSVTIVDKLDNGDAFTYSMVDNLDAYVNVHLSSSELGSVVAQGDMGSNAFTGDEKSYDLDERAVEGISGTVTFKKKKNGFTLAEIDLSGTPDGGMHPAHIHMNSFAEGGDILVSLNIVDGKSGESFTDIRANDAGEVLDYENILTLNGYVNVHLSATQLGTVVAQGDIGTNELTGASESYDLDEKDVPGISGEITFDERKDGTFLATIDISGTPVDGMHPAHIHKNSAIEGGPIAVTFNPVNGNTGISRTSIRTLDDGTAFTYQLVKSYDGYVNVHFSADDLMTIVSQGNIGINN